MVCFCCCCILFVCLFCAYSSEAGSLLEPEAYVSSGGWKIGFPIRAVVTSKCRITSLVCRCWYLKQRAQLTAQPSLQPSDSASDRSTTLAESFLLIFFPSCLSPTFHFLPRVGYQIFIKANQRMPLAGEEGQRNKRISQDLPLLVQ